MLAVVRTMRKDGTFFSSFFFFSPFFLVFLFCFVFPPFFFFFLFFAAHFFFLVHIVLDSLRYRRLPMDSSSEVRRAS